MIARPSIEGWVSSGAERAFHIRTLNVTIESEIDTPKLVQSFSEEAPEEVSRVLIVEDDDITRRILQMRLSKSGYNVETAEDGQVGWEKAQEFRPDIIISDWMMPRMDGTQLAKRVKEHPDFQSTFFI